MQFAEPQNLWTLFVLLPMIGVYVGWWRWKNRLLEQLGDRPLLSAMAASQSARRQIARSVFVLLGTALLCIAYAQPQWGQTHRPIKRTGVDIVFALDLSSSMSAKDVAPNRLEAAKNEIETTLEVLRGDRVGLVVFTAISFVQAPLTTDYGAIRFYLDRLESGQMPLGGTSLGRAVTDAVGLLTGKRLQNNEESDIEMRRAKNQVIVLITDGEDHESDPDQAAQLAAGSDIKIVTVGFGSTEGQKIPIYRPDGTLSGYKRDRDGNLVHTVLDEKTLEEMAEATGGLYVPYEGEHSVANALVDYINALEKSEIETMLKERYTERYQFFAFPGLILLIIALILGERRPRRKLGALAMVSLVAFSQLGCERMFESTVSDVDYGIRRLEDGQYTEALAAFREAEKRFADRPELRYDIGRALLGMERWDEATTEFARALETDDLVLRFDALYNLGMAHAGAQNWRQSWQAFQDALMIEHRNPDAIDKDRILRAQHNLEVAWRNYFPPCALLEDKDEDNDSRDQATKLEQTMQVGGSTLCGGDDDWYAIPALAGSKVTIEARFRDLREDPEEDHLFLNSPTDLQITLFDSEGKEAVAVDQGDEPAVNRTVNRKIELFAIEDGMVTEFKPFMLLKVSTTGDHEFRYDLHAESIPPCPDREEGLEDNDTPDQAQAPGPGTHQMHYCAQDDDWFSIDIGEGETFFADVKVAMDAERQRPPDLRMEIYGPDEKLVAEGEREGAYLTAGVREASQSGRYLIHIYGGTDDEQGPYEFELYSFGDCPLGDDRMEENDDIPGATPIQPNQQVVRYLRACDGDLDFYRVEFPSEDDKSVEMGLARIAIPPPGDDEEPPPFQFDMVSSSGDQILVAGSEPEEQPEPPPAAAGQPEPPPPIPIALVIKAEDVDGSSANLRVSGENEFYHLVQLSPPEDQGDQQPDESEEPNEGNKDPGESEEEKDGEDGKNNDEAESEDQGGDKEDKSNPSQGDNQPKPQEEEQSESPTPQDKHGDKGRLQDILDALEATDDNFQMRKALQNMPGRFIEKDW